MKKPPYLYTLTPRWGADVRALLEALGAKTILGVTLKVNPKINAQIASAEVSRTGQLTGTPSLTLVRPNAKGVYAVRVPAHAAAILTLSG
jgi:hypothetical protein